MRVGLVRHFKVKIDLPEKSFITRDELSLWFNEYDNADVEYGEVELSNIEWKNCCTSDLPRAIKTAEKIYHGNIITMQGLRELNPLVLFKKNLRLPMMLWMIFPRIKQLMPNNHVADFKKKISTSLDEILLKYDEDTLIVSHGFTMIFLKKELRKRGFKGVNFRHPRNGKLYIYEK